MGDLIIRAATLERWAEKMERGGPAEPILPAYKSPMLWERTRQRHAAKVERYRQRAEELRALARRSA